ncbi:acyltransferase [Microbacterium sp.]|uniref:acyltransferase n=1 Tax=Microbacterium sp. TaxID=51671 RepID=UPI0026001153|nr:acyltransferase [Microbacterium sp.]
MALRDRWQQLGIAVYNIVVTHVPSHTLRLATLRAWGARIGSGSTVGRGSTVLDIKNIRIGEDCSIGFRCVLDARGGIEIGDNVALASDTHIITGHHLPHSDTFEAEFLPVVIESFVWVASRATIVAGVRIGRGAVVGACSLVRADVDDMAIVAGVPARPRGVRRSSLNYSARYRRLFY